MLLADGASLEADAVILATPAFVAGDFLGRAGPELSRELRMIPHASSALVTLGYRLADVERPLDAHGYVVPRVEGRPALACTWTSAKWADRSPEGTALIRVFLGRFGQETASRGSDDELLVLSRAEVRQALGIIAPPVLTRVHRWPRSMPQYIIGHRDRLAAIERRVAGHPGLRLAGNAYRGVGIPDCIASGETAAKR